MAKPTGLSDEVRSIFEERKGQLLGHQQLFDLMGLTGVDKTKERNGLRDVLSWLVSCGYLVKTGARATAAYHYSGQGMRFHKATAEELRERRIERGRAYRARTGVQPKARAARLNPQVAPRERRMDHNTVSRPRPVRANHVTGGQAMTVEEFVAQGGVVQRLPASWEQRA